MTADHENLSWLTIKSKSTYQKTLKQKRIKIFQMKIFSYILFPFCFRYASFYHKSEHKNLLEFIIYFIKALMISEFCCNENFGFPYKISLVNELSEQLLMSQFMLFNLFKSVFLMFTKLWQCRKKCAVDSTSKLHKHRGFMQSSKL